MSRSKSPGTVLIAALAAVTAVLAAVWRPSVVEAVYPVERAAAWFSRHVLVPAGGLVRRWGDAAVNERLTRELDALRLRCGDLERLERENDRLRQALGYATRRRGHWLAAPVMARGLGSSGDAATLRIEKGSLDGVRAGAVVAVGAGLVGRIGEVTPHTATVVPVTDPSVQVACEVVTQGAGRVRGVLSGGDESALSLRFLTEDADVPVSALVRTSGLGGVFPAGISVGRVRDVRRDALGRRVGLVVESFVDLASLSDVFVEVRQAE